MKQRLLYLPNMPGTGMSWNAVDVVSSTVADNIGTETAIPSTVFAPRSSTSGLERIICSKELKMQPKKSSMEFSILPQPHKAFLLDLPVNWDLGWQIKLRPLTGYPIPSSLTVDFARQSLK